MTKKRVWGSYRIPQVGDKVRSFPDRKREGMIWRSDLETLSDGSQVLNCDVLWDNGPREQVGIECLEVRT